MKLKIFCVCFFSLITMLPAVFAGKTELTTFYPSAYGEYINLKSTADSYFATASGNIGIGTTAPTAKLSVAGLYSVNQVYNTDPVLLLCKSSGTRVLDEGVSLGFNSGTAFLYGAIKGAATNSAAEFGGYLSFFTTASSSAHYERMRIDENGNVGVGTTSPAYRLDVLGSHATDYMARIKNSNALTTTKGLIIDLGTANASRVATNRFIDFAGAGVVAGKIQGGASAVVYTTTAADFAEYFRADPKDMPQPGELVEMDPSGAQSVQKASGDVSRVLVGVVSSSPAFVGNGPLCKVEDVDCDADHAKYNVLVALVGQVSVKVNTSHGPIAIADPIAASETPGEGAKAIDSGHIVGYAQEVFSGGSGTIKVLIRPQYYYNPKASS